METKQEIGKIQSIREYNVYDIYHTYYLENTINRTLCGPVDMYKTYSDILEREINVFSLYQIMNSYMPNEYIKTFIDKLEKPNLFASEFKAFGVYERFKVVIDKILNIYNKEDVIVLLSNPYYTDCYEDVINSYKKILDDFDIKYIQTDFLNIDYIDVHSSILYNKENVFWKKYNSIEDIFENERDMFNGFEMIKRNKEFDVAVNESYAFDINCFDYRYKQDLINVLSTDEFWSNNQKDVYINDINDKHLVIINEDLFTSNLLNNIFDVIHNLYLPKTISVITSTHYIK